MSKFKSPYGDDRIVPLLGGMGRIVKPGEVVTVPDELDVEFRAGGWEEIRAFASKPVAKKEGE